MARILTLLVVVALGAAPARADEATAPAPPILVGTKQAPPFAIKLEDGTWTGISIELWKQVAAELGVTYRFVELDLESLLRAVERHEVDVGVGAITINASREQRMDFTHPFYSTGIAIAVAPHQHGGLWTTLGRFVSGDFAKIVVALLGLLGLIGLLVWLAERRRNASQFGGGPVHGIGAGLWWSAVTMTTVGYGDKAPVTVWGRGLALVWMFAALIVTSLFTASITSALTLERLESSVKGPEDLGRASVTTIAGSTSAAYLARREIDFRRAPDVLAGMRAVAAGDVDAIVYDAPILKYTAKHSLGDAVLVLPTTVRRQDYGFALPPGSPLREPINRALLAELARDRYRALVEHYLGE